jgi:hypothetical protein
MPREQGLPPEANTKQEANAYWRDMDRARDEADDKRSDAYDE